MAIIERQIRSKLDSIITDKLREGKLPRTNSIQQETKDFMNRVDGGPIFRAIHQDYASTWDTVQWNREIEYAGFDLGILFEELIGQAISLMRRTGWAETSYRSQRGQLDLAISELDDVLFAMRNADYQFMGVRDIMVDMSKVDLASSTNGVVDLN